MKISIVGPDGSGKTAVTQSLARRLGELEIPYKLVNKWDVFDVEKHPECRLLSDSLPLVRQCISEMKGPSRLLFIYWTLYSALDKVSFKKDTVYLFDGYWEKHAAVEALFGIDEEWILNLVKLLPTADKTILLDADANTRYSRKDAVNDFVPYEFGFAPVMNRESFVSHQEKLMKVMRRWGEKEGWTIVNATRDFSEVYNSVESIVLNQFEDKFTPVV